MLKEITFSFIRSNECDVPNIAVESSNFQEDESNNREKNFNKEAYSVSPLTASCSSSDEEENVRAPGGRREAQNLQYHADGYVVMNADLLSDERQPKNTHVKHVKGHKLRLVCFNSCISLIEIHVFMFLGDIWAGPCD